MVSVSAPAATLALIVGSVDAPLGDIEFPPHACNSPLAATSDAV